MSQAGANQRAGRAGRVRSGCCYRLYCQKDFDQLKEANEPEMRRSELSSTILRYESSAQAILETIIFFRNPNPDNFHIQVENARYIKYCAF